jgi:predicted permease
MTGRQSGWALHAFRAILKVFPRRFRERFGPSMEADFIDQLSDARERGRLTGQLTQARALTSLGYAGVRERIAPAGRRAAPGSHALSLRPTGGAHPMELLGQDLKFALRSLARRPGFTAVAVLTLALGIGANTAIFSVINGVLLKALPYENPDRIVALWQHDADDPTGEGVLSQPNIEAIAVIPSLETAIGYRGGQMTLTGMGDPELVSVGRVTEGLLETFGAAPVLGRDLRAAENSPDAPRVVLLSHRFWDERFGGDPTVLGSTVELAGVAWEIVGVAPAGFDFPSNAQMWRPYRMNRDGCWRGCQVLEAVGRLGPDATLEQAAVEMEAVALRLEQEHRETNFEQRFRVLPLADQIVGRVRGGLWVIFGAVGVVLLIACANVANLLLVRGAARRGEVAVRAALGASRRRLAGQVLLESLALAVVGGLVGLLVAVGAVDLLKRLSPGTIPRMDQVGLDLPVLAFAAVSVVVVAVLFGLSPAFHMSRTSVADVLARSGGRGRGRGGDARSRSALLATEVALSVVLLVGAGLLLRTFVELHQVELGYETEEILRFRVDLPTARYGELERVAAFYGELEEQIAALPGVAGVGSIFGAPLGVGNVVGEIIVDGRPKPDIGQETYASLRPVTAGYLETMRIPVLRGRGIQATDGTDDAPVALANETLVRQTFPGQDPIGQRVEVTVDIGFGSPQYTIVGIVGDIRSRALTRDPVPELYVPHAQVGAGFQTVAVRGEAGVGGLVGPIRDIVRRLDPALPLRYVETMTEAVSRQAAPTRFYLVLVGVFAALALLLAGVGLYGVVSYLVSQRTREIGVRMALGAEQPAIVGLVLRQGIRPATWGLVGGLGVALVGSRVMESLLFGVAPRDPAVFVGVPVVLLLVVLTAAILPARRASRVDPVRALRAE